MMTTHTEKMYRTLVKLTHAQEMHREKKRETLLKDLGNYTLTQLHILSCIQQHDAVNNKVLSDALALTKAAVSKAVNKLLKDQLITTYQVEDNQKSIFYQLTKEGEHIADIHHVLHEQAKANYLNFLATMDDETLAKAQIFLEALTHYLEE